MIGAIITQLKTGTYKTVIPYGSERPSPPYVVVKAESDFRGRRIWIYLHVQKNQQAWLEDYVFGELGTLLANNWSPEDRHENQQMLMQEQDTRDVIVNDDNTISMGRAFLQPKFLF